KRQRHTMGVLEYGLHLCDLYGGADTAELKAKYRIAALCHDLYRGIAVSELDPIVEAEGLPEKYKGNPSLAHGKLAAIEMERAYGIDDPDILNAVNYHTTGRPAMSLLETILYVADAAEPNRDYPGVDDLRALAERDLDEAALFSMERTIAYVAERGLALDGDTEAAAEYLRNKRAKALKKPPKPNQPTEPRKNGEPMENREIALKAAKTLDAKKGLDVTVIDVSVHSSFADYLVIATGGNERQIGGLVSEVEDALAKDGILSKTAEGRPESGWVLMDYGDIIVNVFSPEMRTKYALERVWGDCPTVDVDFTKKENA
ncbi:MAG: bis(5'-nucleosyl)-tetraphosphatase (symmetrical) YqeK, partial [Firmicutes bacterium]|nr:bis(5'-nucleosyl)-tetraphosphatase (symmetrical) YqeK [Bacillota bacterium]